jgi:hypothetical protein
MKKLFCILTVFIYAMNMNAQFYSGGADYTPKPCSTNDSIIIYDTLTVRAGIILSRQATVKVSNDTVYIHETFLNDCVDIGDAELYRTTNIGKLQKGTYIVKIFASYRNFICSPNDTFLNSVTLIINVHDNITDIKTRSEDLNILAQTIFHDNLDVKSLSSISTINVFDLYGKLIFSNVTDQETLNIITSDWQNGMYILMIKSNETYKKIRILKT